ncbi:DUF2092 domain-containing protein [Pseudoxanthomonas sp. 3HH-4]|uniref:DUF2092 domain-containing protein n=1 Tax=Pseudoxanthomonas sp. 3HH-4 TaxID=1690214 RepID=UPI00163AB57A|nr:DUF2092 domain-containing protein [Pseudoxanthomonas sp. 3HH-4]
MALAAPQAKAQAEPQQETPAVEIGDVGGVVTADAQAVLDRMTATLRRMGRYSVTAAISRDEVLPYGYKLQNNETARMWVDAPQRLRLEVQGDIKNRAYIYDGSTLTTYVPDLNVYAISPAPGKIGDLVSALLDAGVEMPLIDLLYQGVVGDLTQSVKVGLIVGDSEVDGTPTDHLAFRQADVDWQLWVEKGANALPRKLLITTRYEVGDPQYVAVLHWDLKPKIAAGTFAFRIPEGAVEIPMQTTLAMKEGAR